MIIPPIPICPQKPWLAPLAGYSDLAFRLLCREQGCSVAVTEMVSAKGLIYGSPGTQDLLQTCPEDSPLVVQLFGADSFFLGQAIQQLRHQGYQYFDLNCGCSVRKVVKTGSGAALLTNPQTLVDLAQKLIPLAAPGCMGFKLRLGWSRDEPHYLDLARSLEQLGTGWITLHPRYATQGFAGEAQWTHLAQLKQTVSIPVIASGDLFTAEDGLLCVQQTKVNGLMFARGALQDPYIFHRYAQLNTQSTPQIKTHSEMFRAAKRLYELYCQHNMPRVGLLKMRTLVPKFFKGLANAKTIRRHIGTCSSWDDIQKLINS